MNPWDTYFSRINTLGATKRDELVKKERYRLENMGLHSLSLKSVRVDGLDMNIMVTSSNSYDEKKIHTLPGETISQGGIVLWNNENWIITQVDPDNDLYYRGTMRRCNYLLRWVSDTLDIIEQWCVIDQESDSFSNGEKPGSGIDVTTGDAKTLLIISSNENTIKFNRTTRFLVDSYDSQDVLAYRVVKPFRLFGGTNKSGIISFSLSECNLEDTDNIDLHIANYYKYFPDKSICVNSGDGIRNQKKVWF